MKSRPCVRRALPDFKFFLVRRLAHRPEDRHCLVRIGPPDGWNVVYPGIQSDVALHERVEIPLERTSSVTANTKSSTESASFPSAQLRVARQ